MPAHGRALAARTGRLLAALLLLAPLSACELAESAAKAPTSPMSQGGVQQEASPMRRRLLGAFLDDYWRLPVPAQGEAPSGFSPLEASLDPAACGACHPRQYADWQGTLHAGAFSPGFAGQLIEGALAAAAETRACQTCHAPLAEQQPEAENGAPNPGFDPSLRRQGIVCASCHLRAHQRFGPLPRPASAAQTAPPPGPPPHGGFETRSEFSESRFCAPCHQFFDDPGVNGKPLENTFVEWQASPHARAGRSCQSCHMPDRAHLWRGIHDPEMVRAAVDVELHAEELEASPLRAALLLRSREVGHAFPSYVTPRVFLALWQVDAADRELPDSRMEATIGREIDFASDPWRERFDTRVAPGESVKLEYRRERRPGAVALVGRVTVDPDFHYRSVFASLLDELEEPAARRAIQEAHRRSVASVYLLAERRRSLGAGR